MATQGLSGFQRIQFSHDGIERDVYRLGGDDQPAVLIMLELPGMTRHTLDFARRLHDDGYSVYIPLLFGGALSDYEPFKNLVRCCIQKEIHVLATHKPSAVSDWLRALCRQMQADSGRPVGAVGMCFSGGFVLSLMIDEAVAAPVMSQPGHAGGMVTRKQKASLGIPEEELQQAIARSERDNIPVLGLRFTKDAICPPERFQTMEKLFGDRFLRVDIDSSIFNPYHISPLAHSVLTVDYDDAPDHPTRRAYETLIRFLDRQLKK